MWRPSITAHSFTHSPACVCNLGNNSPAPGPPDAGLLGHLFDDLGHLFGGSVKQRAPFFDTFLLWRGKFYAAQNVWYPAD